MSVLSNDDVIATDGPNMYRFESAHGLIKIYRQLAGTNF